MNRELRRRVNGRMVGGVAGGIGDALEVDPLFVRLAFVILTFASGVGLGLYALFFLAMPKQGAEETPRSSDNSDMVRGLAFGSIVLGVALLLQKLDVGLPGQLLWPIVLMAAGVAMVWRGQSTDGTGLADRFKNTKELGVSGLRLDARNFLLDSGDSHRKAGRMAMGVGLVFLGAISLIVVSGSLAALRQSLFGTVVFTFGIGLLLAPWFSKMLNQISTERSERVRVEERAVMAAHLHDSVLQTLAIIQKKSANPRDVVLLARRQERELRSWLYSGTEARESGAKSLGEAIAGAADSVEADHGVVIDVVQVGDVAFDDRIGTLVAAAREAMVNAAKHSGASDISVYVEVQSEGAMERCEIFIRDRGVGFDTSNIAPDRRGIRDSLVSRMDRLGGTVRVHSEPGHGTEVELVLRLASTPVEATAPIVPTATPATSPAPETIPASQPAAQTQPAAQPVPQPTPQPEMLRRATS